MPTYEYLCDACEQKFEVEQRITEDAIKKCIHCGKLKARRLITQGNFILQGGGWYSDLYSSSSATSNKKPSSTTSQSTPAPSESKPVKTDTSATSAKPAAKEKKP